MVNGATIDLIRNFEGERLRVYRDAVGYLTVGVGHLVKRGEPYKLGQLITKGESAALLERDMANAERTVRNGITALLNENQYGALVSFVFNVGAANFMRSGLRKKINAGDFAGAADEFLKWDCARGKQLVGLMRRRKAERELFLTETTSP